MQLKPRKTASMRFQSMRAAGWTECRKPKGQGLGHTHTGGVGGGYYSVIKKNEVLSFTGKWLQLENIMLSEVNQVRKAKGHLFCLICRRQIQIQIQALSYTHTHFMYICVYIYWYHMFPKVGQLEETEGEGKEEKNDREWIILKYTTSV
jgi:hypothetical protein